MTPGAQLEAYLSRVHDALPHRGAVIHVPTPTRIASRKGGKLVAHRQPRLWVDYIGALEVGGAHMPIALEAKYRGHHRIYHSNLGDHQTRALANADGWGWLAAVYARLRLEGRLVDLFVPYRVLEDERGVGADDGRWRVPAGKSWVDAAERWIDYCEEGW